MKVYVVFEGEYDQRGIVGVYANKADAIAVAMPLAVAQREKMRRYYPLLGGFPVLVDDCDLEEHDLVPSTDTGVDESLFDIIRSP